MIITTDKTVKQIQDEFAQDTGLVLRVYKGNSTIKDGEITLETLKATEGEVEFSTKMKIATIEDKFKALNLKVQIASSDNSKLCNDDFTLAKAIQKYTTKNVNSEAALDKTTDSDGTIDEDTLRKKILSLVDKIDNEFDKKRVQTKLEDDNYWIILDYSDDESIKREVLQYYESIATSTKDYIHIATVYYNLSDLENAKRVFKLAEEKIENFDDALDLAIKISKGEYYLSDLNWGRKLYEKAYEYALKSKDYNDLVKLGDFISREPFNNKVWGREIYQKAYEKVSELDGLLTIAYSVMDGNGLNDKKWATELFKEYESKASTYDELIRLLEYVIDDYLLNDQEWGVQLVEKIRPLCKTTKQFRKVIARCGTQKELGAKLAKEAILFLEDDEEKENLAYTVEGVLEDTELANEIENSSINELKTKYSKSSIAELKQLYAAGIGDGSIDPVAISFDSFVENYGSSNNTSSANEKYNKLLIEAAEKNDVELAQKCLNNGAYIDYQTNDESRTGMWTPLLYATWHGNYEVGKFLIDNGANLKAEDENGWRVETLASPYSKLYGRDGNKKLFDYIGNKLSIHH